MFLRAGKSLSVISHYWLAVLSGTIAVTLIAIALPRYYPQQELDLPHVDLRPLESTSIPVACSKIAAVIPDRVYFRDHALFARSIKESFAVQAREEVPACIVRPVDARQVSAIIKTLKVEYDTGADARFAVRSGGHRPGGGHSSVRAGVLVDLRSLNDLMVSHDRSTVSLGVGSRWGEAYARLENMGLMVPGGRDAGVGVGGFILGGGISYFSSKVGMACDNVLSSEIVLANGTVATASETRNHDLWRALKGGSSNLGVVTRVSIKTFPNTKVWGGYSLWSTWQAPTIWETFYNYLKHNMSDPDAAGPIICIGYQQKFNMAAMAGIFAYTAAPSGAWPSPLRGFQKLWQLWRTMKVRSVADMAKEVQAMSRLDQRQVYGSITIRSDIDTFQNLTSIFYKYRPEMRQIDNVIFSLIVQPLPIDLTNKNSPNILGLDSRDFTESTPILVLCTAVYGRAKDDLLALQTVQRLLDDIKGFSVRQGTSDPFVYLNYAGDWQDPITSYGSENKKFLQMVSQKYDRDRFFQTALEGGFKLGMGS